MEKLYRRWMGGKEERLDEEKERKEGNVRHSFSEEELGSL